MSEAQRSTPQRTLQNRWESSRSANTRGNRRSTNDIIGITHTFYYIIISY